MRSNKKWEISYSPQLPFKAVTWKKYYRVFWTYTDEQWNTIWAPSVYVKPKPEKSNPVLYIYETHDKFISWWWQKHEYLKVVQSWIEKLIIADQYWNFSIVMDNYDDVSFSQRIKKPSWEYEWKPINFIQKNRSSRYKKWELVDDDNPKILKPYDKIDNQVLKLKLDTIPKITNYQNWAVVFSKNPIRYNNTKYSRTY